jgi:nucleoside-diphosphate-sugar epimerase
VGCGCRGRSLAQALAARGHAVRGTTRVRERAGAIEAAGAEAAVADPGRLGTLLPHIEGVAVVCWLMGTATGDPEPVAALHGARLRSLLELLVDTPVRGVVYEAGGSVGPELLQRGSAEARGAAETYRMPMELVESDPADRRAWLEAMSAAVGRVLGEDRAG